MGTNRCPMRYFLGMLDQAAVNAHILLQCAKQNANQNFNVRAYNCLRDLSLYLVTPYLQSRLAIQSLRTGLRLGIKATLKVPKTPAGVEDKRPRLSIASRCAICIWKGAKKRKINVLRVCDRCVIRIAFSYASSALVQIDIIFLWLLIYDLTFVENHCATYYYVQNYNL